MVYNYAIIDCIGKCYEVNKTTNCMCDKHHVPVADISINYLSKYYYPVPEFVDTSADFQGVWYLDIQHTMEEVVL